MTNKTRKNQTPIAVNRIEQGIVTVRGQRVIIDADLASLYGVTTTRLNEQVKRNVERFPEEFSFFLEKHEFVDLMSHFATSSSPQRAHGGRRKPVRVFTEHGAMMAATVLNSPQAVEVSVYIVRAFIKLRELAMTHHQLTDKFNELERKITGHDQAIADIIHAIRQLMTESGTDLSLSPSTQTPDRIHAMGGGRLTV